MGAWHVARCLRRRAHIVRSSSVDCWLLLEVEYRERSPGVYELAIERMQDTTVKEDISV